MNESPASSFSLSRYLSPRKLAFITGTLLLTSTGIICRILGFFYRIFMSRTIGAEGLGLYNMVHPVFSICFAVCAGSVQTALSQYVAANQEKGKTVFRTGLTIAMSMSLLLAWLISSHADFLARQLLLEPRCAPYLPVIAVSVPFAALHACINGYYYGMQKARVPAFSQVAEQVIRMSAVFLIAHIWLESGRPITVSLAVYGHLIGEMASAGYTLLALGTFPPGKSAGPQVSAPFGQTASALMSLALPLMGNRLVLNLLGSAEAVWIPNKLMAFGLSNSEALSVYGVFTSMALPFILFPSAITNSIAVLLLPSAAEAHAAGNRERLSSMISMSLRYSCYMGIFCIGIFTLFGEQLGTSVFHDKSAGSFISILCWLCPFMYLATTMGSILNGMGKTSSTFLQNICAMMIRLLFVLFAIPRFGILGYLCGMLVSELTLALMSFLSVRKLVPFRWDSVNMLLKPFLLLLVSIGIDLAFSSLVPLPQNIPGFLDASLHIGVIGCCYLGLLLVLHRPEKDRN